MPDRIISPPMVGVPAFLKCVCGPSARIGWPLPCRTRSESMMRRAEEEDQQRRGDQRAAGAEGDVAEDVEDRELHRRIQRAASACGRSPRSRSGALCVAGFRRKLVDQRIDQLGKADALRRLDHDDVARPAPRRAAPASDPRRWPGTRLAVRPASVSASAFISGPASRTRSMFVPGDQLGQPGMQLRRMAAEFQHVAEHGDPPPVGRAPASRRAAPSPPSSRPDWRCSSRRSA